MKPTALLAYLALFAAASLLPAAGCQEPPRVGQMDALVTDLASLRLWDGSMQGKGHYAYDAVMGWGPEIVPILVAHLTDETPTAIYEEMTQRNPKIADVAFLMLLELTKRKWQEFSKDGVFISTVLPNTIFCIKWDRPSKFKVQARFREILAAEENK
jgi:hypothetical protein